MRSLLRARGARGLMICDAGGRAANMPIFILPPFYLCALCFTFADSYFQPGYHEFLGGVAAMREQRAASTEFYIVYRPAGFRVSARGDDDARHVFMV